MKIYALMVPLGVASYAAMAFAFLTGLLKYKFNAGWIDWKWHIWAGITAFALATMHLAVAIYVNL